MNSKMQKFDFLFPKRVYRCPCLQAAIDECFDDGERSFADIVCFLTTIDSRNVLSKRIFATTVSENKEHCLFTCETHVKTILLAVDKNMCLASSETDDTICVEYGDVKEFYCKDCVKKYLRLLYSYFYFADF